ncbi:MAG: cytochrome c oxidase subunit I, partial [Solirubrobacteraceae bacterium]
LGYNLLTAVILGVVGYLIAYGLAGLVHGASIDAFDDTGQNDVQIMLGYAGGVIGFLAGLGFLDYPIKRILGHPPNIPEHDADDPGLGKYFRLTTDHKVVGMQYFVGLGVMFFVGGVNAMLIRTELLSPTTHVFGANQYLTLVGMHGSMMMGMMTSGMLGPFANWLVPIMIGSRRMAFPRIEALTFWLLMAAGVVLTSTIFWGGFQTGWTGYMPLGDEGTVGYDMYLMFFTLVSLSMTLLGLNLAATIVTMRAPGMTWSRVPILVWAVLGTCMLMVLASPMLTATLLMGMMDRSLDTGFFIPGVGGSAFLWENLFWVFGHPEVYLLAIPGFGIVLELVPVFARKPLWGYKMGVAGMMGVAIFSFFVWQHHLFDSGIDADLRPFYMLSTEIISLPTGFTFLCFMATLWRGRIRLTVPMLFCLAWAWNFLFGGISGVFNSDVPSDVTTHGSFFVMAHFHYTIMGGLIFSFMAAIYYWMPKMSGYKLNEKLGKVHFWLMFISFNSTFGPLFALGFMGMPRRVVTYRASFTFLNDWVSVSAYVLGASLLLFLWILVKGLIIDREPAEQNPWHSKSIEWQLPTPVPAYDFAEFPVFSGDPYPYGETPPVPAGAEPATAGAV